MTETPTNLQLTQVPTVKTELLIRKPVREVFEAFIDPAITSKFWFTKGSGRLEQGKTIHWEWEMYDISVPVDVKAIEQDRRILIEWPGASAPATVEWLFTPYGDDTTWVTITNAGFTGTGDEVVSQALDSTGGFTFTLAGLKAWLEHGVQLNLVRDHTPPGDT